MAAQEHGYRRIPGAGLLAAWASTTAWLGADHVLVAVRSVFTETYKRFYLRDVQAVVVRRTSDYTAWTILSLMGIVGMFAVLWATEGHIATLAIMLVLVGAFVANMAAGPTCQVFFKTAAGLQHVPTIGRMRNAEVFVASIKPLVQASQAAAPAAAAPQQPTSEDIFQDLGLTGPAGPPDLPPGPPA
ncbi:MAG: hypothetical protein ACE15C_02470 [Phycisphaerae bacterium]